MSIFGTPDGPEPELDDHKIAAALIEIKQHVRRRRMAMVAPAVLAAAMVSAVVAAPANDGGLSLLPDAEANEQELPRVFGSNGVWRLPIPIAESQPSVAGPPWFVDLPEAPEEPEFVLSPPADDAATDSLPASASTPPAPTLGQNEEPVDPAELDWSAFRPAIRVDVPEEQAPADAPAQAANEGDTASAPVADSATDTASDTAEAEPAADATIDISEVDFVADDAEQVLADADETTPEITTPDVSAPAETTPDTEDSPSGEDVIDSSQSMPTDDAGDAAIVGDPSEANPSTPQPDSDALGTQPLSAVATIVPTAVLVHSAHVSITVQVVDDDSSVIDWCNTRVDWGDGSVTGLPGPDGFAACTAPCERVANPSEAGISHEMTFTHSYQVVIDAAPRIFVATGDGCSYTLAEYQLNRFTVVPS